MIKRLEVLECDGIHGTRVRSLTTPRFALLLDGWTVVDSSMGDGENAIHLCPECSVLHLVLILTQMWWGIPGCGWVLKQDSYTGPQLFLYNITVGYRADQSIPGAWRA